MTTAETDRELAAITKCLYALSGLDLGQRAHVLRYLTDRLVTDQAWADKYLTDEEVSDQ